MIVALVLHQLAGDHLAENIERILSRIGLSHSNPIYAFVVNHSDWFAPSRVGIVALLAVLYGLIRFVEAYGLWRSYTWTEWFALLSGAVYLPFELFEMVTNPNGVTLVVMLINITVVAYMAWVLRESRKNKANPAANKTIKT
ncbi:DUF2127 domain-containing protein [Gallaecimonas mangrovi]|uniref:DUF2127 domain-containing protein n=1 Tax=Gallaecimonas mangrovi TaxID=2291597 RepID=UPI0021F6AD2A|nr:DUF2127 domain-containing protein [Gallaecimonas mangrovi]